MNNIVDTESESNSMTSVKHEKTKWFLRLMTSVKRARKQWLLRVNDD